jgi:hypothetical protein
MRQRTAWKLFMLTASYVFYAAWDWRYTLLLAGCTVVNHVVAQSLAAVDRRDAARPAWRARRSGWRRDRRQPRRPGLVQVLRVLRLLRPQLPGGVRDHAPLPLLQIVLPVGISFFTFQAMSYVIDVYRRASRVARGWTSPCTSRSSRSWSRARSCGGRSSCRSCASRATPAGPRGPGLRADPRRAVQEGRHRQRPGGQRSSTRCSPPRPVQPASRC